MGQNAVKHMAPPLSQVTTLGQGFNTTMVIGQADKE